MAKNHWNVRCSNCGKHLKLTVEDQYLGKTVKAICPCGAQTPTTIGVTVEAVEEEETFEVSPELEEKFDRLVKEVQANPTLASIIESISQSGYGVVAMFGLFEMDAKEKETKVNPKVVNGKVKTGTFSKKDEETLKKVFKIKL